MTADALFWVALISLVVAAIAAIATRVLHDFSVSELEDYCRLRRRHELFHHILDRHEQVVVGTESLQSVAIATLILATGRYFWIRDPAGLWAPWYQFFAAATVGMFLLLVVTSWIPWAVVRLWSAPFLFRTWKLWCVVAIALWPLGIGVKVVDAVLRRLAGRHAQEEDEEEAFEDEIRSMVTAGQRDGLLEQDAREMIEGVIELSDTDVADIMTPRSNVDALEINLPRPEVLDFIIEVGRTRIPVFEKTLDNIVGVLFVKDLLRELSQRGDVSRRPLREILRKPWFVPTTKRVDDMLQEFLRTRNHLAIVLDEYQSVAGVVTIEDVLEEIVGEIVDETDKETEHEIHKIDDRTAEAVGHAHLDALNEELGLDLPEPDDFDTIAGLVVSRLGYIPKPGASIRHGNIRVAVLEATKRRVERVRIERLEDANGRPRGDD